MPKQKNVFIFFTLIFAQTKIFSNNREIFFPLPITYSQSLDINQKIALAKARAITHQALAKKTKDEYSRYREAFDDELQQKDTSLQSMRAKYASQLLFEILTDSFMWTLQAHLNPQQHAQLKGIYITLWSGLSETGWNLWSLECLQNLQKIAQHKRLLYLAGGVDVAALLEAGIYNIDIIDPIQETQKRYYFEKYEWFVGNTPDSKIGDTFEKTTKEGVLILNRVYNSINPPRCVWQILTKDNKELGTITFTKRYLEQKDLITTSQLVISFNELIYFVLPSPLGGWNINFTQLQFLNTIYVKQLPKALDMGMLRNLRTLLTMSLLDFKFIHLGSDIE